MHHANQATILLLLFVIIPVLPATRFAEDLFGVSAKITQRHILLLASLLVFSGCASVIDMTRDLARDLSDIDVAGMTGGLLGAETIRMSPEQTAQLATDHVRSLRGGTVLKKVRRRCFRPYSRTAQFMRQA